MFVHPTWFEGMLFYAIPVFIFVIGLAMLFIGALSEKEMDWLGILGIIVIILAIISMFIMPVIWHYNVEVPSVQEKVITVDNWQPRAGLQTKDGMLVISSADDLMMVTTDGEGFFNEENFLFGKFDTRDILNQLKVNGTYKIKYYGWREGFNTGFPNILSVEEVVNETGTTNNDLNKYMGNRLIGM